MAGEKEDWSQGGEVWGGVQTPGNKGGWVGLVCCPCAAHRPAPQGSARGPSLWPCLTVMGRVIHSLTTSHLRSH